MLQRILTLFNGSSKQSIRQASLLLAATALLSNVLGLGRNFLLYRFLSPFEVDVYQASFRVADFIFTILIVGAVSSAFVPTASALLARQREKEATDLMRHLLSLATIFFTLLIIGLWIAMPWLMAAIVPGFSEAKLAATIPISRILLLQTLLFAWSFIMSGMLNSMRRFTSYSLAPLIYNLAIIVGVFMARDHGLNALAWSVVAGAGLHASLQLVELIKLKIYPTLTLKITESVKQVLNLMIPRSISQGANQFVMVNYANLASRLQEGSLAVFGGMNDLQTTPTVIVGNSLAAAFLPTLSDHLEHNKFDEVSELCRKILRVSLFTLIPIVVLAFILRAQIVRLYIGIGSFSWELTLISIDTLVFFLIGVIPASLVAILARVFYAAKDTRTPMLVCLGSSAVAILVAQIGIRSLGMNVAGLALAESMLVLSQAILYAAILYRRTHLRLSLPELGKSVLIYLVGASLAGGLTWLTLHGVAIWYNHYEVLSTRIVVGLFLQMVLAGSVGIATYAIYSRWLCRQELSWILGNLFSKKR